MAELIRMVFMTKEEVIALIEKEKQDAWNKHKLYLHQSGEQDSASSIMYHGIAMGLENALCYIKRIETEAR